MGHFGLLAIVRIAALKGFDWQWYKEQPDLKKPGQCLEIIILLGFA